MTRKLIASVLGFGVLAAAVAGFDFGVFHFDAKFNMQTGSAQKPGEIQVLARSLSLVCPGAAFIEAASHAGAANFEQLGAAQINENQDSVANFFEQKTAVSVGVSPSLSAKPQGSVLLSANQTQLFRAPAQGFSSGATGLLGADCVRPASDFWFLGASTAVGRQALLIVNNPSPVDATFDLELFDESGPVTASATQGLSVMAGKTLVLPLASFAPSDPTLTVHVSSQGGAVAAWVQQKTVRGLVAAGIDFISPMSPASPNQVVPGLSIIGSKAAKEIAKANPDYADLAPAVRLFVPTAGAAGAKSVSVTVLVSGIDAKTFGTVVRQDVAVGQTTDIELSGLSDGKYSIAVSADKPLFASARLSSNSADAAKVLTATGSDFTWISAAEPVATARNIVVPKAGSSSLNFVNQSAQPTSVTLTNVSAGSVSTYALQANSMAELKAQPGANLQVSATSPIYVNLTNRQANGIATLNLLDAKNLGGQVAVRVK